MNPSVEGPLRHRWPSVGSSRPALGPLRDGLFAYVDSHLTNALAEGINLKIRVITRRSFGVPNPNTLIAMILLGCGGLEIPPPYTARKRFH